MTDRSCPACKSTKPLTEFYRNRGNPEGRTYECKLCRKARSVAYRKTEAGKRAQRVCSKAKRDRGDAHDWLLRRKHGIPVGTYTTMYEAQKGRCLICSAEEPGGRWNKRLHLDHNHATGKVRGLLCNRCNRTLGLLKDDISWLQKAASYLAAYE